MKVTCWLCYWISFGKLSNLWTLKGLFFKVSNLSCIIQNNLSNPDTTGMSPLVIANMTATSGGHVARISFFFQENVLQSKSTYSSNSFRVENFTFRWQDVLTFSSLLKQCKDSFLSLLPARTLLFNYNCTEDANA